MNMALMVVIAGLMAGPSAMDGDEYSFSEGSGQYYALRHSPPGKEAFEEVVGSAIAMNRAKRQARKGGYTLEIKGPFGGVREATEFIRREWDPEFGMPRKPSYGRATPVPPAAGAGGGDGR